MEFVPILFANGPKSRSYPFVICAPWLVQGGPYTKLDTSLITTESYIDTNVTAGQTYYYVVTEVDTSGNGSAYSAQVSATIP